MKPRLISALAAALLATSLASCSSASKTPEPDTAKEVANRGAEKVAEKADDLNIQLDLDIRSLSNGLMVLMVEDRTTPVIAYQTWFRVGSVDEKPGITGLAHLFEHMMFKGTEKYGPKQFFERLESKGADVNAYTTREYTVYHQTFTPKLLDQVIDMESDRMSNLKLDASVVDTERQVVLEERRLRTDNTPGGKMQEALWSLAYRVHPYQWPVIGYPEDVRDVPLEAVRKFYRDHYQPSNAVVVVVGNFDRDEVFAKIKKAYDPIEGRPRPARKIPKEPEQSGERRLNLQDHVASQRFAWAYHVTGAEHEDTPALDVLSNILFAGTSSRAHRRLVEEKDIVAGVGGSAYTPTYPGLFIINATMKGDLEAEVAEKALEEVFAEVVKGGVTEEEVQVAVRQLTVAMVEGVRTPQGIAQLVGTVTMILGDPKRFNEDLAKYAKVKPADVKRVAEKYLVPNNRSVVTLLPSAGPVTGVIGKEAL